MKIWKILKLLFFVTVFSAISACEDSDECNQCSSNSECPQGQSCTLFENTQTGEQKRFCVDPGTTSLQC